MGEMLKSLRALRQKHDKSLLKKANVVSVGCGCRHVKGEKTEELCLIVGVTKKLDKSTLAEADIIPAKVDGVTIDVIQVGQLVAFPTTDKFRPAPPGCSIGHKNITAGTFGCVVHRGSEQFILSNNHVLANSNDATIGDAIFQPGPADGGTSADQIGTLEDFVAISFGGGSFPPIDPGTCPIAKSTAGVANVASKTFGRKHRLMAVQMAEANRVDAALCRPTEEITDEILQIGKPVGVTEAELGMDIQKYGRTTDHTQDNVLQVDATVNVSYGTGKIATFEGQLVAGAMSAGGDSGSAILDMNKNIVGLLYAGSDTTTIFCRIQDVFAALNITL